jgi:hypothetical protein
LNLLPRAGGLSFSTLAGTTLRLRVVDWKRRHHGRTRWQFSDRVYERERPQLVSLDTDDPDGAPLASILGTRAGDPAADCDPDLERLLGTRDSSRARDYETLVFDRLAELRDEVERLELPR